MLSYPYPLHLAETDTRSRPALRQRHFLEGAGKKIAFSNGHISTYIDNYFPLKYAQEESCMAVKNLLKVFENSRHFLSYDHFCFSHMGAVGRR